MSTTRYYVQFDENGKVFALSQINCRMAEVSTYDERLIGTTYDPTTNTFNGYTITLTADKTTITADGTDTATITATVTDYTGAVASSYSKAITFAYDGVTKDVTPTNGIATLTFATQVTGAHVISTTNTDVMKNGSVTINA